jgi:RNA polymerase sigma-70 factor (ECF subfamily)
MTFGLDSNLCDRALAGDRGALDVLIKGMRPHVEKQLMRYPVSEEDRHDLVQSTLLQVMRRLGTFRGEASFSTWLFRVTANEALMLMRSQRRQRARFVEGMDLEDLAVLPAMSTETAEDQHDFGAANRQRDEQVRGALDSLPEDYRALVMAHYHNEQGLDEIACQMDLTESAVRSRLHRARGRLRSRLEKTAAAYGIAANPATSSAPQAAENVSRIRQSSVLPSARAA